MLLPVQPMLLQQLQLLLVVLLQRLPQMSAALHEHCQHRHRNHFPYHPTFLPLIRRKNNNGDDNNRINAIFDKQNNAPENALEGGLWGSRCRRQLRSRSFH